MTGSIKRKRRFIAVFCRDVSGIILPYMALMLMVFAALGALAIDVGRNSSLQTQMQAAVDAMSIAGARELDQRDGARARANQAIANLVSNGLAGMGSSTALAAATTTFYSALPAATSGFTGTAATGDHDAMFVAVKIAPKSVPTIFPIFSQDFSASAQAIAGHTADKACGIAPVYICNPYEQSGDSDLQATQRLVTNLDPKDPNFVKANLRKLIRWKADNTNSPGHFGWLQPNSSNCNSVPCLNQAIAQDTKASLSGSCFTTSGVKMATGNKPIGDSMNDRFDLYNGNGPSALFSPAINVRKGYIPSPNICANNAGKNGPAPGDYLTAQAPVSTGAIALTPASTTLTAAAAKNATSITVASISNIQVGMSISTGTGASAVVVGKVVTPAPTGTTVHTSKLGSAVANGTQLTFSWQTAPLPLDQAWTGICGGGTCVQGNGQWDCGNYRKINHGASVYGGPGTCDTPAATTASRYDVYTYENTQAGDVPTAAPIKDWSGIPQGTPNAPLAENGTPICAISKGFTPVWDSTYDPRILYAAIINCQAQDALGNIGGGNSGNGTPVAKFGKVFMTQPFNSDGQSYVYGEMVGLVDQLDSVVLVNQVQLYR